MRTLSLDVSADVVQAYAEAANDFNPIHFDDAAAHAVGLPRRSAHGMISGALLSRLLAEEYGEGWLVGGTLSIKFVQPVLVGERVTARLDPRPDGVVDVRVENDEGAPVIVGTATVRA